MGIGASIVLVALGAILAFATTVTVSGISLQTVGVILMVVGGLGLLLTLLVLGPRRADRVVTRRVYTDDVV